MIGSDRDVCVQGSSEEEQRASKESLLLEGRIRLLYSFGLSLKKFLKPAGIPRRGLVERAVSTAVDAWGILGVDSHTSSNLPKFRRAGRQAP